MWVDAAGGWLDVAVVRSHRLRGAPDGRIDEMQDQERVARLEELRPTYDVDRLLAWPDGFLTPGAEIAPARVPVRTLVGRAWDLAWTSRNTPWHPEIAPDYLATATNTTAHARMFRAADRPGPAVIAIHGYGAGHAHLEELLWPIGGWRRRGLDVVLPVLPFHGRRGDPGRRATPGFPAADPRFTNEGFRQTVHDLTSLIGWLRAEGHGPIGLAGMSLGGYTAALLATLLPELSFVAMVIPLASIADFARAQGRLGIGPTADAVHRGLEAVYRPTSPFSRPSLVAADRVRIVAARGDRITGLAHAARLGAHFGVEPEVRPGSHLIQFAYRWSALTDFTASCVNR